MSRNKPDMSWAKHYPPSVQKALFSYQKLIDSSPTGMPFGAGDIKPKTNSLKNIAFHEMEPTSLTAYKIASHVAPTPRIISKFSIIGLQYLYLDDHKSNDYYFLQSAFITVLSMYFTEQDMVSCGLIKELKNCGYSLTWITYNTEADMEEDFQRVWMQVRSKFNAVTLSDAGNHPHIVALSLLLLIGKQLTMKTIERWFHEKWNSIAQSLAITVDVKKISTPELKNCQYLYLSICYNCSYRASIMKMLMKARRSPLFSSLRKNLEYAEMEHIPLIKKFIMEKHPEIPSAFLVSHEERDFKKIMQLINQNPVEERPFLMLLSTRTNQYEHFSKKRFKSLTVAARVIASIYDPSKKFYLTEEETNLSTFAYNVQTYVTLKMSN